MKEIITYNDIMAQYTAKVKEYLLAGYVFQGTDAFRGHQGENTKVALTNDNNETVICIYINRISSSGTQKENYIDSYNGIVIAVEKFNRNNSHFGWLGDGEMICEKKFYTISERRNTKIFVDNMDTYMKIKRLQHDRYKWKYINRKCYQTELRLNHNLILSLARRVFGYKSIGKKDIKKFIKRVNFYNNGNVDYIIEFLNKSPLKITKFNNKLQVSKI